uniref:Reverse transcriptase Ty1/copia-type domain-containing protein n=1 Tax=Rhizophora mucronata TaxID=61149 RepID=A0A2P2NHE3_RHIMU
MLVTSSSKPLINHFKDQMKRVFEMTNLGFKMIDLSEMSFFFFFGMENQQGSDGIFINQMKYVIELLIKYNMINCKFVLTPLNL